MRRGSLRDLEEKVSVGIPEKIYLYKDNITGISLTKLQKFIKENFGNIRVEPVSLKEEVVRRRGLLFDFIATQDSFSRLESAKESKACHIVITDKLFATLGEDRRAHIRASIYSFPSVISTSGIVEGPAKPRQYYIYKQKYTQLGLWDVQEGKIKQRFKGRFIDYRDRRMTEAMKGYVAQALFFCMNKVPFCQDRKCRLYNAHWQEDLIYAQIKRGRFCARHAKLLERMREGALSAAKCQ